MDEGLACELLRPVLLLHPHDILAPLDQHRPHDRSCKGVSFELHAARGSQPVAFQYLRPPNVIVGSPTVDVNSFSINSSSVSIALPVDIRYFSYFIPVISILMSWQRQQPEFLHCGAIQARCCCKSLPSHGSAAPNNCYLVPLGHLPH